MKKIIFQVLLLVVVCFTAWFALSKVNWIGIFKVKERNKVSMEKREIAAVLYFPKI